MSDSLEKCIGDLRNQLTYIKRNNSLDKKMEDEICDILTDCVCSIKDVQYTSDNLEKNAYIMKKIWPIITQLIMHFSMEYDEKHT